ncbi:MAG: hypothetical protein ACREQM_00890 [Candidatus Dormibacteraceae bacterium]
MFGTASAMGSASFVQYAIYVLIALFVIYRQLAPRPVNSFGLYTVLPVAMLAYGLYSLAGTPPQGSTALLLLGGGIVIGALAGVLRGISMRYWINAQGTPMRRGTWLTIVIWIAYIAARVGTYVLFPHAVSTGETMISIGLTLGVQTVVMYLRGHRLTRGRAAGEIA